MRRVVREFRRRAETADDVAVIDDAGRHRASDLLRYATPLVDELSGTVLLQADNPWRTVAATLAVGLSGGTLAVVNRHTTTAEFAAALEDIQPDVVVAEPAAVAEWAVPGTRDAAVLDGWVARSVSRYDGSHRDVSRWAGGSLIGLTSGSTGRAKGVVQSEAALHYALSQTVAINGLGPGDAVAAIVPLSSTAAYCFGVYLALMQQPGVRGEPVRAERSEVRLCGGRVDIEPAQRAHTPEGRPPGHDHGVVPPPGGVPHRVPRGEPVGPGRHHRSDGHDAVHRPVQRKGRKVSGWCGFAQPQPQCGVDGRPRVADEDLARTRIGHRHLDEPEVRRPYLAARVRHRPDLPAGHRAVQPPST